ncbi:ATP-grasp domain-containing protein [uncultured Desulfuromonas sp.]|uniref:ATP-grasp domain-containing protein n=1 Tax=uncultured Desulfuromonas sp. TaxID=181013 RepID=UPI002AAAD2B7|nr:ATP-grasp domain-containing protein [uncultured Desulfuromonas sp.]
MKKALVLGVGSAQVELIRYLKCNGWYVIGAGYRHEGAGLSFVDRFVLLDIVDVDALSAFAKNEAIDLVYSVGSDLAVFSCAGIANRLGLKTLVSPALARQLDNKAGLRTFLDRAQLSPVRWTSLREGFLPESWEHFPAFIKPIRSQGQRGIVRVNSSIELQKFITSNDGSDNGNLFLLEEALPGREISANVLVCDATVCFQAFSQRVTLPGIDCGIPQAHLFHDDIVTTEEREALSELIQSVVTALEMQNGPLYFQLKMTPAGPKIIEFTPRLDGCHLWRLIYHSCGFDLLDAVFSLLEEQVPVLPHSAVYQPCTLEFFFERPGTQFDRSRHPFPMDTLYGEYYYQSGELVRPINGHMEKVGYVIREGIPLEFKNGGRRP